MKSIKGVVYALVSSGTFGLIPLFAVPLLKADQMGVPSILFYRFFFSALIMGAICLIKRENFKIRVQSVSSISFFSLLYAATALCLTFSYTLIPSGVATTIHFLYPIFVSFLMVTFFKEKKSIVLFLAAIISLVGVAFLCWNGSGNLSVVGVLVALLTVVTYGLYIVSINVSKAGKINAEILTFYILLFGAFFFFIFAMATTGIDPIPDGASWTRLLLLAFLPTVVSDLTLILAIKYAGSTITSILGSMEPMVAVLVGVYCFSEYFDIYTFVGIVLVVASVGLIIFFSKNSESNH
jgi:drug/metabolite transporter (DMT)-like permease